MRRPLVLCVLSFLLGAAAGWLYQRRAAAARAVDDRAGRIPPVEGRLSGTLDDLLADESRVDGAAYAQRWAPVAVAPGPHPGSALPLPDGGAPSDEYTVKGVADRFHTTESPHYPRVRAQVWFRNPTDAERAGLTRWDA
ncbi:sunset domain-containing protein [Actinokineospora sp. NPDC004072]